MVPKGAHTRRANSRAKFTRVAGKTSVVLTRSDYRHLDRELTFKTRARDHDFPRETSTKHMLLVFVISADCQF